MGARSRGQEDGALTWRTGDMDFLTAIFSILTGIVTFQGRRIHLLPAAASMCFPSSRFPAPLPSAYPRTAPCPLQRRASDVVTAPAA